MKAVQIIGLQNFKARRAGRELILRFLVINFFILFYFLFVFCLFVFFVVVVVVVVAISWATPAAHGGSQARG